MSATADWQRAGCLVFDSWALLAFLLDEKGAAQVEDLIGVALGAGADLLVSVVNMGEVWYSLARAHSEEKADSKVTELLQLGFHLAEVDWLLSRRAAAFKAAHRMAYGDCFAAALAQHRKTALVTGDLEFEQLSGKVGLVWLKT